jgi:hypothetical protein
MYILLISLLVAIIFYVMNNNNEHFTPSNEITIKQCDFNDKNLSKRCKEIRDGCNNLVKEEERMKTTLAEGCDLKKDANTVRETISNRRECVNDVERLIRTKYAKKELCAQIKNMPKSDKKAKDKKATDKKAVAEKVVIKIPEVLPYSRGTYSDAKF